MANRKPKYAWRFSTTSSYGLKEWLLDRLVPERVWYGMVRSSVEHLHGPDELAYGANELVVVCLVRDGEPYVDSFVEHYFSLGAKHVVFLDNGSEDGTVPRAREHDNITILRTRLPYRKYALLLKQYLLRRFGRDRWVLCADIDELFDYPYSDVVSLESFLEYLDQKQYTAVAAHLLDMFPEESVGAGPVKQEASMKELHRFCDLSEVSVHKYGPGWSRGNVVASEEIPILYGGIRKSLFGANVSLTKHPLVFMDGDMEPVANSSHRVSGARVADITCVLYHYKFVEHFHERVARAVSEENYYDRSAEYKAYLRGMEENSILQIKGDTAREIEDTNELVNEGFLTVSDDYLGWVDREERDNTLRLLEDDPRRLAGDFLALRRKKRAGASGFRKPGWSFAFEGRRAGDAESSVVAGPDGSRPRLIRQNEHLKARVRELEGQLESVRKSRAWKMLSALHAIKSKLPGTRRPR